MNMAAGVSINMKTVIPFLGFCVILAGTKSVKESQHHPAYHVAVNDPSIEISAIWDRDHLRRHRRQADAADFNNNEFATSTKTPDISPITTEVPPANTTLEYDDHHDYYTSKYETGDKAIWVHLDEMGKNTHDSLSNSHRTAASVGLSFTFPFYGHPVSKVTIATGGFLYMSDFLHQWLTATQYIAPLMANFDSGLGNSSNVHYADNGTMFAVWWENLHLQDQDVGAFSFQALLGIDGTVIFNYQRLPIDVVNIGTSAHPVKVGLSDAYYIDRQRTPDIRRRTIYEYHRVEIARDKVNNGTTIIMKPLPTCGLFTECVSCINSKIDFSCQWCTKLGRCSDGLDRHRQDWLEADCMDNELTYEGQCPTPAPPRLVTDSNGKPVTDADGKFQTYPPETEKQIGDGGNNSNGVGGLGVGGVVAILLVLFLIVFITSGFIYAYLNPQSKAGIWLIEHRPSNLRAKLSQVKFWKRQESGGDKYEVSMGPDGESVA